MVTRIEDTVYPVDAPSVLGLFRSPPRLLALGEPTHGEDTLLAVRNAVFRQLVEQAGYRTVAIESDCLRGLVVDDYVTSGTGTVSSVIGAPRLPSRAPSLKPCRVPSREPSPRARDRAAGDRRAPRSPRAGRPGHRGPP